MELSAKAPANWVTPAAVLTVPRSIATLESLAPVVQAEMAIAGKVMALGVPSPLKMMLRLAAATVPLFTPVLARTGSLTRISHWLVAVLSKSITRSCALPRESKI